MAHRSIDINLIKNVLLFFGSHATTFLEAADEHTFVIQQRRVRMTKRLKEADLMRLLGFCYLSLKSDQQQHR